MLRKRYLIPMAALTVLAAGAIGVSRAAAATTNSKKSLVQDIADTFHVDQSKVQAVFDQHKAANQAGRETAYENRLAQAVAGGKLTADQKSALIAEHQTLQAKLDAAMKLSGAERRAAQKAVRTQAQAWAKDHGIDVKWLLGGGRMGGRGLGRQ